MWTLDKPMASMSAAILDGNLVKHVTKGNNCIADGTLSLVIFSPLLLQLSPFRRVAGNQLSIARSYHRSSYRRFDESFEINRTRTWRCSLLGVFSNKKCPRSN